MRYSSTLPSMVESCEILSLSELVRYVREGGEQNAATPPAPGECARDDGHDDMHAREDCPADGAVTQKGSKQEMVIAMLHEPDAASLEEIGTATGGQRHTIRGAISATIANKLGFAVVREKRRPTGELVYRIKR